MLPYLDQSSSLQILGPILASRVRTRSSPFKQWMHKEGVESS